MKQYLVALLVVLAVVPVQAKVAGKMDLSNPVVDVIVFRELNDGLWMGGAQKTIWKLSSIDRVENGAPASDVEVMHVAGFWASRPEVNSHIAYGPSLGVNIGGLAHELMFKIAAVAEIVYACPPWVAKVGSWSSLDVYGGYRPNTGYDEHHWIYGVGGKVTIPLTWQAFVSKEQGGGL